MTYRVSSTGSWAPGRFMMAVVALFILQAGLIWVFAERQRKAPEMAGPELAVRLAARPVAQDELATMLFAEDPTLFQSPNRRGFSGRAWMAAAAPEYHAAETRAPDVWLSMDGGAWKPDPLGTAPHYETSLALADPLGTEFEPSAIFLEPDPPPSPSAMRIEGALAKRRVVSPAPILPAQGGLQLLRETVVQMAVDASGLVVSARLTSGSGSASADAIALAAARAARFEPDSKAPAGAVWGDAIFSWQTMEPASLAGK